MTPEQQRIKIAESLGTPKHARFWALDHAGMRWWAYMSREIAIQMHELFGTKENPVEEFWDAAYLPDYPEDLNAMHQAIRILTDEQRITFRTHLTRIWTGNYNLRCGSFPNHDDSCNATAKQRAEAFLRTLNLWEE